MMKEGETMRSLGTLVAISFFLPLLPNARAAGRDDRMGDRESKDRAAMKACLTGNFSKGVEILTDLFIDTKDLVYIFNQGRCFEQNRRYEDAMGRFREYLVQGKTLGAEERADAEKHIASCQSYLGKVETAPPQPKPAAQAAPAAGPMVNPEVAATQVCEQGACMEMPSHGVRAPPLPTPLRESHRGHFGAGSMLGFHGWGHIDPGGAGVRSADVHQNFWPGVHLSGYAMLSRHFFLGGYFFYAAGEVGFDGATKDQSETGFGLSLKSGSNVGEQTWLGFVGDLGALFHTNPGDDTLKGISLFPRFEVNHVFFRQGGMALGVSAAMGPLVIPYTDGRVDGLNANFWMISIQGIVGLVVEI